MLVDAIVFLYINTIVLSKYFLRLCQKRHRQTRGGALQLRLSVYYDLPCNLWIYVSINVIEVGVKPNQPQLQALPK